MPDPPKIEPGCSPQAQRSATQIIIFGASGDLTTRKLVPALVNLARQGRPAQGFSLFGVARRPKTDEQFRNELREALSESDRAAMEPLASRIHYVQGNAEQVEDLRALSSRLDDEAAGQGCQRLFYLSLKPELFVPAVENLSEAGLLVRGKPWNRVIVEKPFGHDLASARAINQSLHELLAEDQIYRIDHYLGKETVQNLFAFRFSNTIFEPLWNRNHVELVQITVAEEVGMEKGRAAYYDTAGALRDMLQNHMLQILALVAMEPPSSLDPEMVRGQKLNVMNSLKLSGPAIRARYAAGDMDGLAVGGYREEEGVARGSSTETYVALRAEIDTWRWAGVPFLLRHGKRLKRRFTEVKVQFRVPPLQLFEGLSGDDRRLPVSQLPDGTVCALRPNVLTLSIQPREALSLSFGVKVPGRGMVMTPAELAFDYRNHFGEATTPAYERLLLDALEGDPTLFLRSDEVEASWRFADTILQSWAGPEAPPCLEYPAGSWGPPEAEGLFHGCEGGWSRG
jgi:glucose-6-phosphate 1-dehydrogenase